MSSKDKSFRNFEHDGWEISSVCTTHDETFGTVTRQSVQPLLDAAGVGQGTRVLDVCTGLGYAAGAAGERP